MKKLKKFMASPAVTIAAFVLAIGLLAFSGIGGARAALTYYSENYVSTVQLHQIQVALVENGAVVDTGTGEVAAQADEGGTLLQNLQIAGKPSDTSAPFLPGVTYREELAVRNPASTAGADVQNIDEYVRVTVRASWLNSRNEKDPTLAPDLIELPILEGNGWIIDKSASTAERTVLYYNKPLQPDNETPAFTSTLTINDAATRKVERTTKDNGDGTTTVTTTYAYDDAQFVLDITVDAVQTHNAEAAIRSAWGREVTIAADGTLTLVTMAAADSNPSDSNP